jgi:hypothetical protein
MVRGVRVLYGCGAVVMGTCGVTTLHLQEMVKPELPPLLEVLSNLSMESSRMFCSDGDPLWAVPTKVVPESSPFGERLRLPKQSTMNSRF